MNLPINIVQRGSFQDMKKNFRIQIVSGTEKVLHRHSVIANNKVRYLEIF